MKLHTTVVFESLSVLVLVFWLVTPCGGRFQRLRELTASIIRVVMEALSFFVGWSVSSRLHGATSQRTANFIPVAVGTSDITCCKLHAIEPYRGRGGKTPRILNLSFRL